MEYLHSLQPIISQEANIQAADIFKLMQEAASKNHTSIIYKPNTKRIHPLVKHVLESKGYLIEEIKENYNNYRYSISIL